MFPLHVYALLCYLNFFLFLNKSVWIHVLSFIGVCFDWKSIRLSCYCHHCDLIRTVDANFLRIQYISSSILCKHAVFSLFFFRSKKKCSRTEKNGSFTNLWSHTDYPKTNTYKSLSASDYQHLHSKLVFRIFFCYRNMNLIVVDGCSFLSLAHQIAGCFLCVKYHVYYMPVHCRAHVYCALHATCSQWTLMCACGKTEMFAHLCWRTGI